MELKEVTEAINKMNQSDLRLTLIEIQSRSMILRAESEAARVKKQNLANGVKYKGE